MEIYERKINTLLLSLINQSRISVMDMSPRGESWINLTTRLEKTIYRTPKETQRWYIKVNTKMYNV